MHGVQSVQPSESMKTVWQFFVAVTILQLADVMSRGIIVPGGFGHRGTEGMIAAVKWAREQKVPFLGICLGFQVAVIEWARNVCDLQGEHGLC